MLIYKATNLVNGKVYIGMTTKTLEHRAKVHKRDSQRLNTYFIRQYESMDSIISSGKLSVLLKQSRSLKKRNAIISSYIIVLIIRMLAIILKVVEIIYMR